MHINPWHTLTVTGLHYHNDPACPGHTHPDADTTDDEIEHELAHPDDCPAEHPCCHGDTSTEPFQVLLDKFTALTTARNGAVMHQLTLNTLRAVIAEAERVGPVDPHAFHTVTVTRRDQQPIYQFTHPADCHRLPYLEVCAFDQEAYRERDDDIWPTEPGTYHACLVDQDGHNGIEFHRTTTDGA